MSLATNNKGSARIPELDGLRGVAITLVVIYHFLYCTAVSTAGGLAKHVLAPLRLGWTGVDLFFVLSGFLIGGILLDARESSNFFETFYTRRLYRILPLYGAVVLVCFLQMTLIESRSGSHFSFMLQGRLPWLSYVFFVQNFWMAARNTFGTWGLGVTWSLAVEEQFYITLPLLIWLVDPKKLRKLLVGGVIAAPLLRTLLCILWPDKFMVTFAMMPCRADALLLGVLAALVMRTPADRAWIERNGRPILRGILVLLVGCVVFVHKAAGPDNLAMRTFGYSWMALLYSLILLYSLTQQSSLMSRVLRVKSLRSLGKIAYGVYLLHSYALALITAIVSPIHRYYDFWPVLDSWLQVGITTAALLATIAICNVSWRFFEQPLVQMGHRSEFRFDPVPAIPSPLPVLRYQ